MLKFLILLENNCKSNFNMFSTLISGITLESYEQKRVNYLIFFNFLFNC